MDFIMLSLKSVKWVVLLGVLLCLSCSARGEQKNIGFLEKSVRGNEQGLFLDAVVALRLSSFRGRKSIEKRSSFGMGDDGTSLEAA